MKIVQAELGDVPQLYELQLLAFESEAEMIGSRDVPALQETVEDNQKDFKNWTVLKAEDDFGKIIGAIRYREIGGVIEIGRLMIHPDYRHRGFAQKLLVEVDAAFPNRRKELYTCTKSWSNILLYKKMGYEAYKEHTEESGLSFVHMKKN